MSKYNAEKLAELRKRWPPCLDCGRAVPWATQACQFSRLRHNGLSVNEAKGVMPLCRNCTSKLLRRRKKAQREAVNR